MDNNQIIPEWLQVWRQERDSREWSEDQKKLWDMFDRLPVADQIHGYEILTAGRR